MNTDINTLLQNAYAHHMAGDYIEAIQDYQASLQLNPRNANAHYDLHLAYRDTGQLLLAFQELEVAARLLPDDRDVYASKSNLYDMLGGSKNVSVLEEIVEHLPNDAEDRQVLLGLLAHRRKDYLQALIHFKDALREQPDITFIQGYLGRTLLFLGRSADAQVALSAATRDDRAKPQDLYNLGAAEARLRRYVVAVHALERAVQLDQTYYKALIMLASTEWRLGHWRSAWRHLRQAVKCSPEIQAQRTGVTA